MRMKPSTTAAMPMARRMKLMRSKAKLFFSIVFIVACLRLTYLYSSLSRIRRKRPTLNHVHTRVSSSPLTKTAPIITAVT